MSHHGPGTVKSCGVSGATRKADRRLPGKGNSNFHCARPVHQIISMIKCIRTSRLSVKNSFSQGRETVCGMDAVALWRTDDRYLAVEVRVRAKRELIDRFQNILPAGQYPSLILAVVYVPSVLDSGQEPRVWLAKHLRHPQLFGLGLVGNVLFLRGHLPATCISFA